MTSMETTTVWTDPELSELIADDPELAAIADALLATGPTAAAQRGRRLRMRFGLLAAALAAVAALVLFEPWGTGGPGLTGRALAALGSDPVLHVVTEQPTGIRYVSLATGKPRRLFERQEIWYDRGRGYVHTISRAPDGSLLDDELETPQGGWTLGGPILDCSWIAAHPQEATKLRVSCNAKGDNGTKPHSIPRPVPTVDPVLGAFLDGYRQALADGEATETGTGTLDGTPVIWLAFPYGNATESVALDATTYRPLLVRGASTYRIVSIETVDQTGANFERPTSTEAGRLATAGGVVDRTQLAVDPTAALRALPGAVWVGSSFENLPLAGVERDTLHTRYTEPQATTESSVGLQLLYGATTSLGVPDRTQPSVQLWESKQPELAYWWGFLRGGTPPAGLFATFGSVGEPPFGATGFLVHDGVYITVMASTPQLALDAARALTPISP